MYFQSANPGSIFFFFFEPHWVDQDITLWHHLIFVRIHLLFCVHMTGSIHCVHACACRGQGTSRVSWFSPSIFVWVLGVTLRLPGLWSHLLNYLSGPDFCLWPTLRYASTVAGLMTAKSEAGHRDRLWTLMIPVSLQPSFWSCGEWWIICGHMWHRALPPHEGDWVAIPMTLHIFCL